MDAGMRARSRAQSLDEVWKWTVGAGILVVALAPLSLPILILTVIAVLPLAVPLLAMVLLVAAVAVPVLLLRKAGRSLRLITRRPVQPSRPTREPSSEPAAETATGH
jgi:hypothetical protein